MKGPGKYDDICAMAREKAMARGAVLIILDGSKGHGFSVQAPIKELLALPSTLRAMADEIEEDITGRPVNARRN